MHYSVANQMSFECYIVVFSPFAENRTVKFHGYRCFDTHLIFFAVKMAKEIQVIGYLIRITFLILMIHLDLYQIFSRIIEINFTLK